MLVWREHRDFGRRREREREREGGFFVGETHLSE
jgi:hypothetical protein